jgi:hypothetical protein
MSGISIEFLLMLGYAVLLAFIALVLEFAARHAHHRSLSMRTAGFTYHPERDIWRCPEEQHLFPVFSDPTRKMTLYRAPASACNACRNKPACTDSDAGREIERRELDGLQYGMQRFHRAFSLTLLVLASLILIIEFCRSTGIYPRAILGCVFILFCATLWHLSMALSGRRRDSAARQSSSAYLDSPRRTSGSSSS